MRQVRETMQVETGGPGFTEITDRLDRWLAGQAAKEGLLNLFVRHTSASLLIQENADPDVLRDLRDFLDRLAPRDDTLYRHRAEGSDDMPAHIKALLTQTHLSVPVTNGRMDLGTWQGVYLIEHRERPHGRRIVAHLITD